MSEEMEQDQRTGISRRTILRRGAVIGGALWVSPVIQSLTNAAQAHTSPPFPHYCCSCDAAPFECHLDGVGLGIFTEADCAAECAGRPYTFCHTHNATETPSPYTCGPPCAGPGCVKGP